MKKIKHYFDWFMNRERYQVGFLIILSALVFSYQIGRESLWLDEIYTYYASNTWNSLVDTITWKEKNMWLYHILMYFWKYIGTGAVVMRSLSTVFAVLAVVAIYKVGKEIHSKLLGLIAGIFLSLNTFFLYYAQEARGYTLFTLLFITSSLFLLRYIKTKKSVYAVLYVLSVGAAFYTHLYTIMFVPLQALFLLWHSRNKKKFFSFIKIYFFVGLSFTPLILAYVLSNASTVVTRSKGALSWMPVPGYDTLYKYYLSYASTSHMSLFIHICLLVFLLVNLFIYRSVFLKKQSSTLAYFSAIAFVPVLFLYGFSVFVKPLFIVRYLIFTLPAYLLVLSIALVSIQKKHVMYLLLFIMIALNINVMRFYHDQIRKEQWNQAVQFVNSKYQPGDKVVVFPKSSILPINYYTTTYPSNFKGEEVIVAFPNDLKDFSEETVKANITSMLNQIDKNETVWVISRVENLPVSRTVQKKAIEDSLSNRYETALVNNDFKNLTIYYFSDPL